MVVREFERQKSKSRCPLAFFPPVLFNCLCNLKHHAPFKEWGLQDLQAGWAHCVADSKQLHPHSNRWLSPSPLPLLQGLLRAGGGDRVHVFCVMFVWGHCLPTFNTFPLHSSVLKPHFDLGDKNKIITCCSTWAVWAELCIYVCINRQMICGVLEEKVNRASQVWQIHLSNTDWNNSF